MLSLKKSLIVHFEIHYRGFESQQLHLLRVVKYTNIATDRTELARLVHIEIRPAAKGLRGSEDP